MKDKPMLIQLKQSEIEKAIHAYIVTQGISLTNKLVDMEFTSGRKSTGISVEVNIGDAQVQVAYPDHDFVPHEEDKPHPKENAVTNKEMLLQALSDTTELLSAQPEVPVVYEATAHPDEFVIGGGAGTPFVPPEETEEPKPVVTTTSLFG